MSSAAVVISALRIKIMYSKYQDWTSTFLNEKGNQINIFFYFSTTYILRRNKKGLKKHLI